MRLLTPQSLTYTFYNYFNLLCLGIFVIITPCFISKEFLIKNSLTILCLNMLSNF